MYLNNSEYESNEYDVVIMGAGFAGLCQARHLMLNIPNIKVAMVDPLPMQRTEKDLKVGESLIEVAALFLCKELGLHDYLIENHTPKSGLNFHWAKDPAQTEVIDDYFHIWANRQTPISSFHLNRAQFEQDLLAMNIQMGAAFYNGRVIDVDLSAGDAPKEVQVKLREQTVCLKAKHVIDAAGRKFIIGRKTDNILFGPENLLGVNNGSAWLRVKGVERTIFHSGYHPEGTTTSHYYATNHFFGKGHWLWMIPIDKRSLELSIGIVYHHDVIPSEKIKNVEEFRAFLKANHTILSNLIDSGEIVDFHHWPKLAHRSKVLFSPDNWYVIGDAAHIFDAFYSYGTTMIAFSVTSATEIIRAKLANELNVEEKRTVYNTFNLAYARSVNCLFRDHAHQLGHASIMSWRIYFEYMWWFGVHIATFIGKWHLDLKFARRYAVIANANVDGIFADLCQQFHQLVDQGANIGLMDGYRADQLLGHYGTLKHFDDFLENTKFEPRRCNVFAGMKAAYFYIALWYVLFQWKAFGLPGLLNSKHIYYFMRMLSLSAKAAIAELIYKFKTRGLPPNSFVEQMRLEFKNHQHSSTVPIANYGLMSSQKSDESYEAFNLVEPITLTRS